MKITTLALPLILLPAQAAFSSAALAQQTSDNSPAGRKSVALTIYNNDLGVVRDVRTFDIRQGMSEIHMTDVPSAIDPTTVKITSLDHSQDVEVIEQNYEYDLVSQQKLLEKYLDKTISVTDDKGVRTDGTLLAVENDKLTLSTSNGIVMLPNLSRYTMSVPQVSSGLITKPTLVWHLQADHSYNAEPLEVLYQTGGMRWHTEYIAALSPDDKSLDLTGWVSLENNSGASFSNAKLKLVAGDLHRVAQEPVPMQDRVNADYAMKRPPQFEEHGMFEYHVYDLGRQTDLANNEVKQISLLSAEHIAATKRYTYTGGTTVGVTINFENSEKNHLGIPMPMGVVRVMKRDKDGTTQFVGEDRIQHTPRDEKVSLRVGDAFDLKGERQVVSQRNYGSNADEATIEITLRNHKDEDVTIDAVENLGTNWEVTKNSMDFEKKDASTIVFHAPVKARGETKITYTVMHRY